MKKFIILFLALVMLLSLAACGKSPQPVESDAPVSTPDPAEPEAPVQSETPAEPGGNRVLVAYFSATGTTKTAAELIAQCAGADIYEIVPEQPYTAEDLNYSDDSSRTSLEMNDPDARPEISGSVDNMADYEVIFIGYPIWWGDAPRILNTFIESYDFTGKTLIPFCTSGGSGISTSAASLAQLCPSASWLEGRRFNGASQETVLEWLTGLGILPSA